MLSLNLSRYFSKLDSGLDIELVSKKETDYTISYVFKNVIPSARGFDALSNDFPQYTFTAKTTDVVGEYVLVFAKYDLKTEALNLTQFLEMNKDNDKALILGMSHFGLYEFDLSKINHLYIYGETGLGKTSFLKYLILLTLMQNKTDNILIDMKGTEFGVFKDYEGVLGHFTYKEEVLQVFDYLSAEIVKREFYFKNAFTNSVENIHEYIKAKKEFDLNNELPDFKLINVFIDESTLLNNILIADNSMSITSALNVIMTKARACGIRIINASIESPRGNWLSDVGYYSQVVIFGNSNLPQFSVHKTEILTDEDGNPFEIISFSEMSYKGNPIHQNNSSTGKKICEVTQGRARICSSNAKIASAIIQLPHLSHKQLPNLLNRYCKKRVKPITKTKIHETVLQQRPIFLNHKGELDFLKIEDEKLMYVSSRQSLPYSKYIDLFDVILSEAKEENNEAKEIEDSEEELAFKQFNQALDRIQNKGKK